MAEVDPSFLGHVFQLRYGTIMALDSLCPRQRRRRNRMSTLRPGNNRQLQPERPYTYFSC